MWIEKTGLDYFGARYFSSSLGRFTSPDPIWVTPDRMLDPQRLNLYSYVRNNPLKYNDPSGMELQMGDCGDYSMDECFELLKSGLSPEDRGAVSLIDNNCSKGAHCVSIKEGYKSTSENFQVLQKAVNDRSVGRLDILSTGETTNIGFFASWSKETGYSSLQSTPLTMNGPSDPFAGYTFFEYHGKHEPGAIYTPGKYSQIVINSSGMADIELIKAMHHEIRHLVLGDFGRTVPNAAHSANFNFDGIPVNNADYKTLAAEREAGINAFK